MDDNHGISRNSLGTASTLKTIILLLVIFNSGGVTIVPHFTITIVTLYLLMFKLCRIKAFPVGLALKVMTLSTGLLMFNLIVTRSWGGAREFAVLLSYILTACLLLITYHTSKDEFSSDLYLALKIILFHALATFMLQFIVKPFLFELTDRTQTFAYIFYYAFKEGKFLARNQGIFWEPGVLQIFLNLLLYITLFVRKNFLMASLTSLAILTTFSSTGYVILAILMFFATYKSIRKSYWGIIGMMTLVPLILVVASGNIYEKFTGHYSKSASVRMFDAVVGVSMVKDHPLLGVGLDQASYKEAFYSYGIDQIKAFSISNEELEDKGITNSVLFVASAFGLPIALILMRLLYKQTLLPGPKSLLFVLFFIGGFFEPVFNTPFFCLFFLSSFIMRRNYMKGEMNRPRNKIHSIRKNIVAAHG